METANIIDQMLLERRLCEERLVRIDEVIASLRRYEQPLAVGERPPAPSPAPLLAPTPPPAPRGRADWDEGRRMYEAGASTKEIAKALGVSTAAVYNHKLEDGWTRATAA